MGSVPNPKRKRKQKMDILFEQQQCNCLLTTAPVHCFVTETCVSYQPEPDEVLQRREADVCTIYQRVQQEQQKVLVV